jgi:hypothetical protein
MRGDCRLPKYLETERRFVLCTTAMKIQTDTVQTLADLLGFDAETTHELLIHPRPKPSARSLTMECTPSMC